MSDDSTWDPADEPTAEELAATDALFDALAAGQALSGEPSAELLSAWRADLDERVSRAPVVPISRGRRRKHLTRGAVAGIVVAGIAFSGTGVAAALTSQPGDLLYGVRKAVAGPIDDANRKAAAKLVAQATAQDTVVSKGGPSAAAARSAAAKDLAKAAAAVPSIKDPGRKKKTVQQIVAAQAMLGLSPSPVPTASPSPEPSTSPSTTSPSPESSTSPSTSPDPSASPSPGTSPDPSASPSPSVSPSPSKKPHKSPKPSKTPKPKPSRSPKVTPSVSPTPSKSPRRSLLPSIVLPTPIVTLTPNVDGPSPSGSPGTSPSAATVSLPWWMHVSALPSP